MPPITARASGIMASPPGAKWTESGSMEATRVSDVIRIGRSRIRAAAAAASCAE